MVIVGIGPLPAFSITSVFSVMSRVYQQLMQFWYF